MIKLLKNTTSLDIELEMGLSIPAMGQNLVNVEDYLLLGAVDSITEMTPLINSGDIVVNDGSIDLIPADAIRWIEYQDRARIQNAGVDVTQVSTIVNFGTGLTATDDGNGKTTVISNGLNSGQRLVQVKCVVDGDCDYISTISYLRDRNLNYIKKGNC